MQMKKSFLFTLFTFCMLTLACGFTSCSDDDDENYNFYGFTITKVSQQGGSLEEFSAMQADMARVETAIRKEFGLADGVSNFTFKGDSDSCDKEVIARFNSAVEKVQLQLNWTGVFAYAMVVTRADGGSKTLVEKTFTGKKGN